jgi:hypothetical protein
MTMSEDFNDHGPNDEREADPQLAGLLRAASPEPPNFLAKCQGAAHTAMALLQMRRISQRMSPPFMGVSAYLRGLAAAASVDLSSVLVWAGLSPARLDEPADQSFGTAWARLALALRLSAREAQLHLRLTFADEVHLELWPSLGAELRSEQGGADALARCESFLDSAAKTWSEDVRGRLRASESAFWAAYRKAAAQDGPA